MFLHAERHEFREHHNYSSLRTRESSKSNPERHEFWEHHNYSSLWTRESSKSNPERQEFEKMLSLTSAKMPTNKESIHFPEFHTFCTTIQMHPLTSSNTNQLIIFLGTPSNTFFKLCRQIVIYSDSSTLAQDAV